MKYDTHVKTYQIEPTWFANLQVGDEFFDYEGNKFMRIGAKTITPGNEHKDISDRLGVQQASDFPSIKRVHAVCLESADGSKWEGSEGYVAIFEPYEYVEKVVYLP